MASPDMEVIYPSDLFPEFVSDIATIPFEDESTSIEMLCERSQKSEHTFGKSDNHQAEILARRFATGIGASNQLWGIKENRRRSDGFSSVVSASNKKTKSKSKKRGRHGHLAPVTAKNAHEVRLLRACMLCRLEKVSVSRNPVTIIEFMHTDFCLGSVLPTKCVPDVATTAPYPWEAAFVSGQNSKNTQDYSNQVSHYYARRFEIDL